MTRNEVFEMFKDAVRHVWRNADFVLPHITMSEVPPREAVLASLHVYGGRPQAVGNSLLRRADAYELHVTDALLRHPADIIMQVLIHEAVHLGYSGHSAEFRRLTAEKGGVVAGAGVDSGGVIQVQKKVGARFQTMREFPQSEEREAKEWGLEQTRLEPGTRWRLQWG